MLKRFTIACCAVLVIGFASSVQAQDADERFLPLEVGDAAPDFSLEGSDGKTYTLSQFKGKKPVILAFFPKAFTGGCTKQCQSLRDNGAQINAYDVAYFMVSFDKAEDNKRFAEMHNADYPILSDPNHTIGKKYNVETPQGYYSRHTYYIAKNGTVAKIDTKVKPDTAGEDTIKTIEELKLADKK